ncbi:MAG: hypothetical protein K0U74_12025 [Alphaproteobacteria bacterium]|nr:hypothetical protein [Alphaproteobacteria bacterium]
MKLHEIKKQENIGVALIALGIAGFFVTMFYFGLFGTRPELPQQLPQLILSFSFVFIGGAGAGYAVAGRYGMINALLLLGFIFFVAIVVGLIIGATNELDAVWQ